MIYGENARQHLHHSVAFECKSSSIDQTTQEKFERFVGHVGYECYTPSMPQEYNDCQKFFINWAIGSEVKRWLFR